VPPATSLGNDVIDGLKGQASEKEPAPCVFGAVEDLGREGYHPDLGLRFVD
jgi:hypothetical protein